MKQILEALASLPGLEPLLALLTTIQPGSRYETGETIAVSPDDSGQVISLKDGQDSPLFRVHCTDGYVTFQQLAPSFAIPDSLRAWMRLMGTGDRGQPIALGARIAEEELDRRLNALDSGWCAISRVKGIPGHPALDLTAKLMSVARDLRATRDRLFELENTANTRPATLKRAQVEVDAAVEGARLLKKALGSAVVLSLCQDPRGASLKLEVEGPAGFSIYLGGADLNWAVPTHLDWPATPGSPSIKKSRAGGTAAHSISSTSVPPEVQAALSAAVAKGRELKITEQLAPAVYAKVKRYLASLGGKWVTSRQVHVFDRDAAQVLAETLGGSVVTDRDWDFFPTPSDLVKRMLAKVNLQPGMKVLEPQAGQAAIASAAAAIVGMENVQCVEAMPHNADILRSQGYNVVEADFLSLEPQPIYDLILMNPPFSNLRDTAHITHAMRFLKPGGQLSAFASVGWRFREVPRAEAFKTLLHSHQADVEDIAAGAFSESGTDVPTVLITMTAKRCAPAESTPATQQQRATRKVAPQEQQDLFDAFVV